VVNGEPAADGGDNDVEALEHAATIASAAAAPPHFRKPGVFIKSRSLMVVVRRRDRLLTL
jgi:hypothetical protein